MRSWWIYFREELRPASGYIPPRGVARDNLSLFVYRLLYNRFFIFMWFFNQSPLWVQCFPQIVNKYVDESLRIGRDDKENIFVLKKADPSEEFGKPQCNSCAKFIIFGRGASEILQRQTSYSMAHTRQLTGGCRSPKELIIFFSLTRLYIVYFGKHRTSYPSLKIYSFASRPFSLCFFA
jgi:hypothetical protein